jgi:hypothetical protein
MAKKRTKSSSKKASSKKASSKKASKKKASKKKAAKKTAAKKTVRKAVKRAPVVLLTAEERGALLNPITNYDDVVERFVRAWENEGARMKAPGYTPGKLSSLLAKAKRATEKEERLLAQLEPKLAAAMDARMKSQDAVWRALLDVWAMAKPQTRTQPELGDAFAFMAEVFPGGGRKSEPS